MPLYEYECPKCKDISTHIHKVSDNLEYICNNCSTPKRRIMSAANFRGKGEGWHGKSKKR